MRIAAHNGAVEFGGGEKWTLLLLRGLQARGHDVHFYCRDEAMAARAEPYGVPAGVGLLAGHLMLPDAWRFADTLRSWRADALILGTFKKVWLGAMAGRLARVPTVVARIGLATDLPGRHWTYRTALRRWTDAVLVNADGIRREFVAGLPAVDPARIVTVYDGIDLAASSGRRGPAGAAGGDRTADGSRATDRDRAAARTALGLAPGRRFVGSVTRLDDQKRVDRMIDALALLPSDVHLAVAGTGPLEDDLRRRARDRGVVERVHFLGYRTDVASVLAALDVFLITSDREGMANAMLEALAAGVPVVSTPVSGAAEALAADPGGPAAGLIVPPTPEAVADAAATILADPVMAEGLAAEGVRRARTRFSFDGMLDAWEHVLGGGAPGEVHQGASPLRP